MIVKYAIRAIDPLGLNGPAYLQKSEYGLQFTNRASQPYEVNYFDSKEEALNYMELHFNYKWFEVVEVFVV